MRRRGRIAGAIAVLASIGGIAVLPGPAGASQSPNVNWTALLPALPSPTEPQPGPVPFCPKGRVSCVRAEIRRLTDLRDRLGCDHRAVFARPHIWS